MSAERTWVIVSGENCAVWQSTGFYLNLPEGHPDRGEVVYRSESSREASSMPAVSYDTAVVALRNWFRNYGRYALPDGHGKNLHMALYNIMDDTLIPADLLFQ